MPAPTLVERLLADYAITERLPAISGGDGEDDPPADPPTDPKPTPVEFTPEQHAEINRLIAGKVKAARDKAIKDEQDRIKAAKDEEDAERQRKADEERGEFGKVKDALISERDQIKTEAERIKGEYEAVAGLFAKQYQAALTDIPDDLKLFQPADNAGVLERVAFLDKLTEALKKRDTGTTPGNRPNPKPGNGNPPLVSPLSRQQITSA